MIIHVQGYDIPKSHLCLHGADWIIQDSLTGQIFGLCGRCYTKSKWIGGKGSHVIRLNNYDDKRRRPNLT